MLDLHTFGITGKLRLLWIQRAQMYSCVMMLEPTAAFSLSETKLSEDVFTMYVDNKAGARG